MQKMVVVAALAGLLAACSGAQGGAEGGAQNTAAAASQDPAAQLVAGGLGDVGDGSTITLAGSTLVVAADNSFRGTVTLRMADGSQPVYDCEGKLSNGEVSEHSCTMQMEAVDNSAFK